MALLLAACFPPAGPKYAKVEPAAIKALDVVMVGGETTFCPTGSPPQVKVVANTTDGKRLETWTAGEDRTNKLDFGTFEWSVSAGSVDDAGRYRAPADPLAILDRVVTIRARVAGNPSVGGEVAIKPTYDCGAEFVVAGASGQPGWRGESGRRGRDGQSGGDSGRATDGEHGEGGGPGGDGGNGGDGPRVHVALTYIHSSSGPLILARVVDQERGAVAYALVAPNTRPVSVAAAGGEGGSGGDGGEGGAGGMGGSDTSTAGADGGNGGDGGNGANGGSGGDGGRGGEVLVEIDRAHPELARAVVAGTPGGGAGRAGWPGHGGSAGSGGSSNHGKRGRDGRAGMDARGHGGPGREGPDGRSPEVRMTDVAELFGKELANGFPIERAP